MQIIAAMMNRRIYCHLLASKIIVALDKVVYLVVNVRPHDLAEEFVLFLDGPPTQALGTGFTPTNNSKWSPGPLTLIL
jgi:hypothetical protein